MSKIYRIFYSTILFFILAFAPFQGHSQYYSTGQDPASIKWRQINTDHFQIIYPKDFELKAQQLAWVLDKVYDYGYKSLNHQPRKISVLLHTHTVKANGMVAWSPKRMELYTTPHPDLYAQEWLDQLAIHEFRHVVQMDKIQDELPRFLPILFGEQAAAAAVGAYLPFWFIEGDAVVTETALSKSGRGRIPSFLMENKAQALQKGLYSYNKASLGSYKDYVPNRYNFGYWMVGGIREKYGAKIWSDVLDQIAKRPFSLSPVNRILKKETGLRQAELYKHLFKNYKNEWQQQLNKLQLTPSEKMTKKPKYYANYTESFAADDSNYLALKSSRSDIERVIEVSPSGERTVITPGNVFEDSFSARGNLLIWAERRPNIRWEHGDRSVIVVYNRETKARQEFHFDNNLFSPSISPDLLHFAAVEIDRTNHYYLSVFDLVKGKRIKQFATPDNEFFFTPCWDDSGKKLYFITLSSKGKSLKSVELNNGQMEQLLAVGFQEIENPRFNKGNIYFTGSFTGIDNIYAFQLTDRKLFQLTSVPFGADYASVNNNQLVFSNYTADGYQLSQIKLDSALWKPANSVPDQQYKLADTLAKQEGAVLDFSKKTTANFKSKKYSKLTHLFNFHSWAPAYISFNPYDIAPGVSFFSQNKLGTAETRLGYKYDWQEEAGKYHVGFKYSGLFPVLDTELSYGKRSSNYRLIENTVNNRGDVIKSDTTITRFEWQELNFDANLSLPLHFSQGKYSQLIQPEIDYSYQRIYHTKKTPPEFFKGFYHSLSYKVYAQNSIKMSELDLIPRWAQVLNVSYRTSLNGGHDVGNLVAAQGYLFFPGFLQNHGIKLYGGYQKNKLGSSFAFGNTVHFPRGYHSFQNTKLLSTGVDYVMPLFYPDFSLGKFIYLKRVRTSLFYDYANVRGNIYDKNGEVTGTFSTNLNSIGADLVGDGHILRIIAPVSSGVRAMYLPGPQTFQFQFLFSVSFNSL
ncbi:MAG TPA: hypothetical protein VKA27_18645 [Sunxiuqinia sp.]|nr:hypothetical protein [Sunxiuqinia sp.]